MGKLSKYKKDFIVAFLLIALGMVPVLFFLLTKGQGERVNVIVSGEKWGTFSLNEDARYVIEKPDGSRNILVIENGYAYMEAASCPDGLCVKTGKINSPSRSIICLPNEVVVEITGKSADVDAVVE